MTQPLWHTNLVALSDALPSISHLELDKIKTDRPDHPKLGIMNGLNISTAPLGSPSTVYSGPPPPYSYASSTATSIPGMQGYISPPESTTRRSTRDDKDSPTRNSLPSIHEALGAPLSATAQPLPGSTPSTAVNHCFPDGPKGPTNPFSQPPPSFRDNLFTSQPAPNPPAPPDPHSKPPISQGFAHPPSPRSSGSSAFRSGPLASSTFSGHTEQTRPRSPPQPDSSRHPYSISQFSNPPSGYSSEPFQFTSGSKFPDDLPGFPRGPEPYGDTVKRHLEVFDAELGLNEVSYQHAHPDLAYSQT